MQKQECNMESGIADRSPEQEYKTKKSDIGMQTGIPKQISRTSIGKQEFKNRNQNKIK